MIQQFVIDNIPAPIDFSKDDPIRRLVQNAKNLIMTRMGEVPYDRYRGFDPALFDLPIPKLNERLLQELDRVMLWEPHVEVVDAEATVNGVNDVVITCTIEIETE